MALIALDIKNALGQIRWPDALNIAVDHVPHLAQALAALWTPGTVDVYTAGATTAFDTFAMDGSVIQVARKVRRRSAWLWRKRHAVWRRTHGI